MQRNLDIEIAPVAVVVKAAPAPELILEEPKAKRIKYAGVNGRWPEGTNDGRSIKLSGPEAITAAKRLYRKAMGRPFKGSVKLTSGNRQTWVRRGVLYVNPDEGGWRGGGGLHEIVHSISHLAARRIYGENHGMRHAFIERTLIDYAVKNFLGGRLKSKPRKPKAPVDIRTVRRNRIEARLKAWEAKRKRAENAIRKLKRQAGYYDRMANKKAAQAGA